MYATKNCVGSVLVKTNIEETAYHQTRDTKHGGRGRSHNQLALILFRRCRLPRDHCGGDSLLLCREDVLDPLLDLRMSAQPPPIVVTVHQPRAFELRASSARKLVVDGSEV